MIAQIQYFITSVFILTAVSLNAQNMAVTDKGDTVILYQDGTWSLTQSHKASNESDVEIRTTKVDPFTGKKSSVTKTWMNIGEFDRGNFFGNTSCVDSVYAFNLGFTSYIGCLEKFKSTVQIQLANKDVIELLQVSPSNCSSFATATFLPIRKESIKSDEIKDYQYDQLNKLANTTWTLIRVNTETQEVLIKPVKSDKHQGHSFFMEHLRALEYQPQP
ncbi:hypothetical protein [Fulvivirga lutea]|uniref:DUF4488 domain-containing protein n=1 Tax=Fulvivirga lutea TaxID=2810512 RepID=A0A975A0V5_9BACT|nr:hypothetical protein [Fulvivirga lutea]QSE97626.1 hypothetical protein JR347_00630 [Fulvivirga lutea]